MFGVVAREFLWCLELLVGSCQVIIRSVFQSSC